MLLCHARRVRTCAFFDLIRLGDSVPGVLREHAYL